MSRHSFALLFCLVPALMFGQDFEVTTVVPLDGAIFETSGLIMVDGRLITHNDSGGGHYLYEVSPVDGEVMRTVIVANASNVDWEDLCYDDDYIYIGEFGNNAGSRTDLRIYRVAITDYLTTPNDTVYCDTIAFSYADQVDFEPAAYTTNFDAEAFIAHNDSLYLFTKNWGDLKTNIYAIPKEIGSHSVSIVDQLETEGLITGAGYDPEKNEIMLTGYTFTTPFLYLIKGFSGNEFSEGSLTRATPGFEGSIQIEGVCALGDHRFYVSSENEGGTNSFLHEVQLSNFSGVTENNSIEFEVYPNPTNDILYIKGVNVKSAAIFDSSGQLMVITEGNTVQLKHLAPGTYYLTLVDLSNELIGTVPVIKE